MAASPKALSCSFCGKSQAEVKKLIAGPTMFICDECVDLCADICRAGLPDDLEKRAKAESAEWLRRTAELRRLIEAISSNDADAIEPIRGPWVMRAFRDRLDGLVNIIVERQSRDVGDISISFTETVNNLIVIAEGVAEERAGTARSETVKTLVVEGVELSLSISAKALLWEFERRAEDLKLKELVQSIPEVQPPHKSEEPSSPDLRLLRKGVGKIIQRNPDLRRAIAYVLRDMLNKLANTS